MARNVGIKGVTRTRKILRKTPAVIEKNIRPVITEAAQAIAADMQRLTPEDEGDLRASIAYNISRDGMSAAIGPKADKAETAKRYRRELRRNGVLSARKRQNMEELTDVFYFQFLDRGTKGAPERNIPPQPALRIREKAFDANNQYIDRVKSAITKSLREVSEGEV